MAADVVSDQVRLHGRIEQQKIPVDRIDIPDGPQIVIKKPADAGHTTLEFPAIDSY